MKETMNRVTMEDMKLEAVKRLEILEKMGGVEDVKKLWRNGKVCYTEPIAFGVSESDVLKVGVIYTSNENKKIQKFIESFETRLKCVAYYGIFTPTNFGELIQILYVSSHKEEWEDDRKELKYGCPTAYCGFLNADIGEIGSIHVEMAGGGLIRIM